ncbi:MAG: GFA family protein [Rhodobacteraceae bacterium]|nr:GFA family protein [Paracoccaceae bacterium]
MHKGQCECGAVAFEINGQISDPSVCHCSQCRRISGHAWAGAWIKQSELSFTRKDGLKWYPSSKWAERGFCQNCGSSLFYHLIGDDERMSLAPGSLDNPTGLKLKRHIYVADKGDYYDISDDLPQLEEH